MALISRQANAHILIGLAPSIVQRFKENSEGTLSIIETGISKHLPDYQIHVYATSMAQTQIHVFNAYLNFEIASYKNNKICYPYLVEQINNLLDSELNLITDSPITQKAKPQATNTNQETCEKVEYWLSVINRLNMSISNSNCRLAIHYSTQPDIVLKNQKNDVLLIASINVSESSLTSALNVIMDVQNIGIQAGEISAKERINIKSNNYGAVETPIINREPALVDKVIETYIETHANKLKSIDQKNLIESHLETIWQNFTLSFHNGASSKLMSINLQIDF